MRQGFTLIEILIVVGIAAMISGLAISYSAAIQRQLDIYADAQRVAEMVLRAKALAVSTYVDPNVPADPTFKRCGYGVSVRYWDNTYQLFLYQVRAATAGVPGLTCRDSIKLVRRGNRVILSEYSLSPQVTFGRAGGLAADDLCEAVFIPPEPVTRTVLHTESAGCATLAQRVGVFSANPPLPGKIRLVTKDQSASFTITVGTAGQVDF